jgi:hypothetical protein
MQLQITNLDSEKSLFLQAVKNTGERRDMFYMGEEETPTKVRAVLRPGECENFNLEDGWVLAMEQL